MRVTDYFSRIGYCGGTQPNLETLSGLCRAHLASVPFENLDVQLGRRLTIDIPSAYDKIVGRRRGGWCYEMNGVFGWALKELGFDVTRMAGGVMRERKGDGQIGNHLCLLVRLDRPYLVDVGFGGSLLAPLPLAAGERDDAPYRVGLIVQADGCWRFSERAHGDPFTFDFYDATADETLFAKKCDYLQTDPASPFVQNLVAQQRQPNAHLILRGRVLTRLSRRGAEKRILENAEEFATTLREDFGLDEPAAASIWPAIVERHKALFPENAML